MIPQPVFEIIEENKDEDTFQEMSVGSSSSIEMGPNIEIGSFNDLMFNNSEQSKQSNQLSPVPPIPLVQDPIEEQHQISVQEASLELANVLDM